MNSKRYSQIATMVGLLIISTTTLFSWIYVKQPQTGDLARIAGFLEHQYGAKNASARLGWSEETFRWLGQRELAEQGYGDALIFGDSFTGTGRRFNWANEFARVTGLDVRATSIQALRAVIGSDSFRHNPPGLVILESVERDVTEYLTTSNRKLAAQDYVVEIIKPLVTNVARVGGVPMTVPEKSFSSFEDRISTSFDYIVKQAWQAVDIMPHGLLSVSPAKNTPPFFSSRKKDRFVYLPEELGSLQINANQLADAISGYQKLTGMIAGTGKTSFSLLTIPNRLSVYLPYLDTGDLPSGGTVSTILSRRTRSFDPIPMFRQQIESGVLDIYWPMDTHLSAVGSKLLAHGYIDWLEQQGILMAN